MTDRLEREVRALTVEWPPTPDIAAAVEARLSAPRARPPRQWLSRPALAWAAALLVLILAGGLAATPAARSALLDLLGLRGAQVQRRPIAPRPAPHPGRLGSGLQLGRAVTLAEARARLDFSITVPPQLGAPDGVWLGEPPRVSLIYARRPRIPVSPHTGVAVLITEFRAKVTPVIQKALGPGTRVTRMTLPGARAYVIGGRPHGFAWIGPDGNARFEDRRLAGTTLLVERDDGILLRAEGRMSRAQLAVLARQLARR